jgi:hypothetical protein
MTRFTSVSWTRSLQTIFAVAGMFAMHSTLAPVLSAQVEVKQGTSHRTIAPKTGSSIDCGATAFLTGITLTQTDRVVGVGFDCNNATRSQTWDANGGTHSFGIGNVRGGRVSNKLCPPDYFIVGLSYTFGSYSADTHGMAHVTPAPMIADLAPVCRNHLNQVFQFQRSYFTNAEDNQLVDVAWDGIGGARSCRAGWAAVKIDFSFDSRRDIDPADPFFDAGITCRRLPIDISHIGSGVNR